MWGSCSPDSTLWWCWMSPIERVGLPATRQALLDGSIYMPQGVNILPPDVSQAQVKRCN
jgi:hypothetical protein